MRVIAVILLLTCGCTATRMPSKAPAEAYSSARSRETVTECLLNRLSNDERTGAVVRRPNENVLTFGSPNGDVLSFTIRDATQGSHIEFRPLAARTPGKSNAERCY